MRGILSIVFVFNLSIANSVVCLKLKYASLWYTKNIRMYSLYILRCADATLYTGITTDLDRRLAEHNGRPNGAKYTRARRPVILAYARRFRSRSAAAREEARIKRLTRAEKLALIDRSL